MGFRSSGLRTFGWLPPGEKALAWGAAHHGDDPYRHSGLLNVKNVDWLEKVSDEQ